MFSKSSHSFDVIYNFKVSEIKKVKFKKLMKVFKFSIYPESGDEISEMDPRVSHNSKKKVIKMNLGESDAFLAFMQEAWKGVEIPLRYCKTDAVVSKKSLVISSFIMSTKRS